MAEGEFLITITKKTDFGGPAQQTSASPQEAQQTTPQGPVSSASTQSSASSSKAQSRGSMLSTAIFANLMMAEARKFLNYTIANYGNMTGDYSGQARINNTLSSVSQLMTIGSGFLYGGPVGGIVATVAVASNAIYRTVGFEREQDRLRNNVDYLRDRAGPISSTGGSR